MSDQLTNNPEALRLFFTEDIYLVDPAQTTTESHTATAARPESTHMLPQLENSGLNLAPAVASIQEPALEQRFQYVGANQRNILILVNDAHNPVSTLQGRELLGNILKAIGLSRNDCALVNYASCDGADFNALQGFFKPQYLFAFGVSPDQLGIPGAAYNSIVTKDQSKLIFSSNLDPLSGDAATKKQLWGSLKQIEL